MLFRSPVETEQENCNQTIINTIRNKLHINIQPNAIADVYRLGRKKENIQYNRRPIKFKLINPNLKGDLIKACINLKPNIYINEFLSPNKKKLLSNAITIKKDHPTLIKKVFMKNSILHIKKINNDTESVIKIKNQAELDNFILNVSI